MTRRYRHIPLSQERLRHYEHMHFHVTQKRFGEYTEYDLDVLDHCQKTRIPYFLIHHPRRYCAVDLDWTTAGFELSLPAYRQVEVWARHVWDLSSAPKKQKGDGPSVTPQGLVVHGLELSHAQQLCQCVWEWLINEAGAHLTPEGGDAA